MNLALPTDILSQQTAAFSNASGELPAELPSGVAEDFESVFVSLLLKEMRQSSSEEGLFAGDNSDSFGAMFDLFLGQHLAESGNFGIADMISRYLAAGASS